MAESNARQWIPIDVWFVAVGASEMTDRYRNEPRFRAYREVMRSRSVGADQDEEDEKKDPPRKWGPRMGHDQDCAVDGGSGLPPGACRKCSVGNSARAQYEALLGRIDKRAS